jgi:hypothetical protein
MPYFQESPNLKWGLEGHCYLSIYKLLITERWLLLSGVFPPFLFLLENDQLPESWVKRGHLSAAYLPELCPW